MRKYAQIRAVDAGAAFAAHASCDAGIATMIGCVAAGPASAQAVQTVAGNTGDERCGRMDAVRSVTPRRGQAMVEFAMISTVAIFVLLVGVQFAMIGQAALAVSELAGQGARYASVNPSLAQASIVTYMQSIAPPNINNVANLNITVNPATAPRSFASAVTVAVSYQIGSLLALPNPFLGVSFPTTLSATETAMSE